VRDVETQAAYESSLVAFERDAVAPEGIYSAGYSLAEDFPVESWRYRYVKRALDVVLAFIFMVFFAIPGLLIAVAVLLTSEGPVFYRETRIGRDGLVFRIWKFRSMHRHAAQRARIGAQQLGGTVLEWRMRKHFDDPRITLIGRGLRRWSLDELPQLINVLRGEMSLIGPRPIVEAETTMYGDLLHFYLAALPGMSGLWQVSGRSNIDYGVRAKLDASYVRSWSLRSDFSILFRTLPAVLSRKGAR
jgi:lipopolysaccharide/colanic/teichoic acid biosynthesis glycosyltransferase